MNVLVLNAGSSSLRFQIIATDLARIRQHADERLARGAITHLGVQAEFSVRAVGRGDHSEKAPIPDVHAALEKVLGWLGTNTSIDAVGHRVVHGGERFSESAVITNEVLDGIRDCVMLAPLHNPKNIEGIEAVRKFFGSGIPQVAVFDTAFHHRMPPHAYLYALPYKFYEEHRIRRYGFHGTSHRFVAFRYRQLRGLTFEQTNVISMHLGNGCSAAAIQCGYPVDTSMGMTPLEGLVMGTRSGDIDATILKIIAEKEGLSLDGVEDLLNNQAGLLGLSERTNDMRELQREADERGNERAAQAIEVFCYRARKYIGAYLAAMGGADAILFTGGIGENSPSIRAKICEGLQWAGVALDEDVNAKCVALEQRISKDQSKLAVFCIPTDEELLIARDTVRCVLGEPHPS